MKLSLTEIHLQSIEQQESFCHAAPSVCSAASKQQKPVSDTLKTYDDWLFSNSLCSTLKFMRGAVGLIFVLKYLDSL